jgi:methyl coenzyme M reductase subunit C
MKVRVHILYKQAEIRANTTIPAIVVSVTYSKH